MLTALSIRDVVLIERLDLSFGPGLTVLTGETGAGKSILLDSLGLALGARADAGLVRPGAEQASVTACFAPPAGTSAVGAADGAGAAGRRRGGAPPRADEGRPIARVHQRPAGRRGAAAACRRRCWWRCRASTSRSAWPIRRATPRCSMRSACRGALRDATAAAWREWRECDGGAGRGARGDRRGGTRRGMAAPRGR